MEAAAPEVAAALVARLRRRDRAAWDELYALYEPRLRRFAYRLTGNPHDAADLVQETFVRVLPRLDRLDPAGLNLTAYLFTTTRNLFLKQAQARRRVEPTGEVPEPGGERPIEDEPERLTQLQRQQEEVRAANAALPQRQRLVLALRELEERSYAEIGEIVGLNENAVAQLISRARENLRLELRLVQVDRSRLAPACQAILPSLSALLDGRLKPAERERVLEHLDGCGDCQAALAAMEEARRRYRVLLPPLLGAGDLKARIDRELEARGYWRPRALRPRLRRLGTLAAGVGAAAVVAAAGYYLAAGASGPGNVGGSQTAGTRLAAAPPTTSAPPTTTRRIAPPRRAPAGSKRRRLAPGATAATPSTTTAAAPPPTTAATSVRATTATTTPTPATTAPVTTVAPATTALAAAAVHAPGHSHHHHDHKLAPAPAHTATTTPLPTPRRRPELVLDPGGPRGFRVTNVGGGAAAPFAVELSDGASYRFGALAPGASTGRSFPCADGIRTATIVPASESGGAGARLAIPACPSSPGLAIADTSPTGLTVVNRGRAAAGGFRVSLSDGSTLAFAGLAPGGSASRTFACSESVRTASIAPASDVAAGGGGARVPGCPPTPRLSISATSPTGLTVANTGTAAAAGFTVTLSDGTSFQVGSLAPGASVSESFACAQTARTASISPASETAPGAQGAAVPACPPQPELTLSSSGPTSLSVTNAGTGAAGPFTVTLSDGTSFQVGSLAPGASVSESFACAQTARTASIAPASDASAGDAGFQVAACPPPAASTLTLSCPGGGPIGAAYTVSGALTPALAGSDVTVTFTPARGTAVTESGSTDGSGAYSVSFTPPTSSTWTAQAQFAGDATRAAATSTSCSFGVG